MRIGIDGNEANIENRVGINQYAYELLWAIYKLQEEWGKRHSIIVYLKSPPREDLPKENNSFRYRVIEGSGLWIITKLMPKLFKESPKLDIFFTPSHYLPPILTFPAVCSIMDLGYLEFSGQFKRKDFWQLKYWTARSLKMSKKVLTISESSRDDIVKHYPDTSKKVVVTPLAYNKSIFNEAIQEEDVRHTKRKYNIKNNYILFLSTLKPSKNIEGLLEAYSIIRRKYNNVDLVIAGKKGWLYESIFEKANQLNISKNIIFTDYIPEDDKPALIKGARLFVMPSYWEGFGIDVLNAMACGVPVVVSRIASLPEVAGKSGVYVDPYNINSIAAGIDKVLSMPKLEYNKLCKASITQARKFSWEKTARKTMEVLLSIK